MQTFHRLQVKKTVREYVRDKIAWFRLPADRKKFYPGSSFNLLPPDWWREESDDELRARIRKAIEKPKKGTDTPTTPAPHPQCRDIDAWVEYHWQCLYEDYRDNAEGEPMTFEQFKDNYDPTTE